MEEHYKYTFWPGLNQFFCGGRIIIGPRGSAITLLVTVALCIVPTTLFILFVTNVWMSELTPIAVVLLISTLCSLSLVVVTEPGILPRAHESSGKTMPLILAVMVNGRPVNMRYCATCHIYRPPRCAHCSICDNCIENFDHHCAWVGTCVGKRNYRYFMTFITLAFILAAFAAIVTFLFLSDTVHHQWEEGDTRGWLDISLDRPVGTIVLLVVLALAMSVGALMTFHCFLIGIGKTTREQLKGLGRKQGNWFSNFARHFLTEIPPSRLRPLRLFERVAVVSEEDADWYSVLDDELYEYQIEDKKTIVSASTASAQLDRKVLGLTTPLLATNWSETAAAPPSPTAIECCFVKTRIDDSTPMLAVASDPQPISYGSLARPKPIANEEEIGESLLEFKY